MLTVIIGNPGYFSAGGGFEVQDELSEYTCAFELTYRPSMTPGKPIDLDFAPVFGAGTYIFTSVPLNTVYNSTNFVWDDYHFELGSGIKGEFVSFLNGASPAFTGTPSATVFTDSTQTLHSVSFQGGQVPTSGGAVDFTVMVNVPDGWSDNFTLRQHFSVPEPATTALLTLGLLGAGYARRRHAH